MSDQRVCRNLKCLSVDLLMGVIFLGLMAFAAWLGWIYFVRGPIALPAEQAAQQVAEISLSRHERYALKHFHNLDEVVSAGIQSGSPCLQCHGDYPHSKAKNDRRGFLNAHAWFVACEVCHLHPENNGALDYRWLNNETGKPLTVLGDEPTRGGAMIVPVKIAGKEMIRLDQQAADEALAQALLADADGLSEDERTAALDRVHARFGKPTIFCDSCHTEHGRLPFRSLLYPNQRARHLESIDMGAMVKSYKVFHLPKIFAPDE